MKDAPRANAPNLGLRERNKRRTMQLIQDVALDLFDQYDFVNVTVEQVAEASNVSPSTVYRYFGTKDRLVLHDEEDRIMVEVLVSAVEGGATLIQAARQVVTTLTPFLGPENTMLRRRVAYMVDEPSVRAAMMQETRATAEEIAVEVCRIHGRASDDLEVALSVATLVNVLITAADAWRQRDFNGDYQPILLTCINILEQGITL